MSISVARNRLIVLAFKAGLLGAVSCGGNVANDTATVSSNAGDSTSSITNQNSSGGSASTGGGVSIYDRCNGLFKGQICDATSVQVAQFCDIPLKKSPWNAGMVQVAIDCQLIPAVPNNMLDAGNFNGFAIDYSRDPAHLVLLGAYCENLQVFGPHSIDVIVGCIAED